MTNEMKQTNFGDLLHEHVVKPMITVGVTGSLIFGFAYAVAGFPKAESGPMKTPCGHTAFSILHQKAGKETCLKP
jgi:hypothetical protein